MIPPDAPTTFLADLAPWSASRWQSLGPRVFPGELSIATVNSVYRFRNGVFLSRAKRPARFFDAPRGLRGMRLVGFLHYEDHGWVLSSEWTARSHAVLWRPGGLDATSFIVTSPTSSFSLEEPEPKPRPGEEPKPEPWLGVPAPPRSGVLPRQISRPPYFRATRPSSMTRIHHAIISTT